MRGPGPLSDAAHRAITLELVRLCLCGGDRPELFCPIREGHLVKA